MENLNDIKYEEIVTDESDSEFKPGQPSVCPGNGELGSECLCDECDYYLDCFPQFEQSEKEAD